MTAQRRIRAVFVRGGTSRALVFHRRDLPSARAEWDPIFLAALGSPDPSGRQLDGLGGGISSLSKVAVVGPSTHPDADVDFTFGQVEVTRAFVDYAGNCGNISSAIGPFALDEGLVPAREPETLVRIHNTNTRKLIHARVPVSGGQAAVRGDFVLPGVPGTGARLALEFLDPGGAVTGRLLPTGPRSTLEHLRDASHRGYGIQQHLRIQGPGQRPRVVNFIALIGMIRDTRELVGLRLHNRPDKVF